MESSGDSGGSEEDSSIPAPSRSHLPHSRRRLPPASSSSVSVLGSNYFFPLLCFISPLDLTSVQAWPPLCASTAAGRPSSFLTSTTTGSPSTIPPHMNSSSFDHPTSRPLLPPATTTTVPSPPPSTTALDTSTLANRYQLLAPPIQPPHPLLQPPFPSL